MAFKNPADSPTSSTPVAVQARHRPVAALGDGLGTVGDHLAAFEQRRDVRVRLELREHHVRIGLRVLVVESDHEADRQDVVVLVVGPAAAVDVVRQPPAHGV
jgi:hypothetical protein